MARLSVYFLLLLMAFVVAEGADKKPKQAKCQDKKYPRCYQRNLYCPDSCPTTCVVDCASCKPVCTTPPPPPPKVRGRSPPPPPRTDHSPPPSPPSPTPPPPPPATSPTPPLSPPAIPSPPPPAVPTPPLSPPAIPIPPTSSSPPPPASTGPSSDSGAKRVKCKNDKYPHCYGMELICPSACPDQCDVDCVTCSPICSKLSFFVFVKDMYEIKKTTHPCMQACTFKNI